MRIAPIAIGLIIAVSAVALGSFWVQRRPIIDPNDPVQVSNGRQVYLEHCAGCHGRALEGEVGWPARKLDGRLPAPPLDRAGHSWIHSDQELVQRIRDGLPGTNMPGFGGALSDIQIAAAVTLIKNSWPAEVRAHQQNLSQ